MNREGHRSLFTGYMVLLKNVVNCRMNLSTINLDEIDVHETLDVLNELKNLDLEHVPDSEIENLLIKLYKHIGTVYRVDKGTYIQRALLLDKESEDFFPKEISRVSFNPRGSDLGRANLKGESIFYGCIPSEVLQGYMCTGIEVLPMSKQGLFQHRFVLGNWIFQEPATFVAIGSTGELPQQITYVRNQKEFFNSKLGMYPASAIALNAINEFITHEFNKVVEHDWEYRISAIYTELIKAQGGKGVMYPSVASAGAGINVAIFPDEVTNGLIKFDLLLYGRYYNRNGDYCNEYTMRADSPDGLKLVWKDEYKRLPRVVKEYYTGVTNYNPLGRISYTDLGKEHTPIF